MERSIPSDELKFASVRWATEVISLAIVIYITGKIGLLFALPPGLASPVWPPSGVALAVLLLRGYTLWPGIFLGSVLHNLPVLAGDYSALALFRNVALTTAIGMASSLQALLGAAIIQRFLQTNRPFYTVQNVFVFTAIEFPVCTVAATIANLSMYFAGIVSTPAVVESWLTWWLGDFIGILIICPLILTFEAQHWKLRGLTHAAELILLFGTSLFFSFLLIEQTGFLTRYAKLYVYYIFIIWAAFRFNHSVLATLLAMISCVLVWGATVEAGSFASGELPPNQRFLLLQVFIGISSTVGMSVAAANFGRQESEAGRKAGDERFRLAVLGSPNAIVMIDERGKLLMVNTQTCKIFGYIETELLGRDVEILIPQRFRTGHPTLREGYFKNPSLRAMGAGRDLFGLTKAGNEIPVEIGLNPVRTDLGICVLGTIIDITERKRAEEHKDLLLQELSHRVKNVLMIVQSLAAQTAHSSADLPDFLTRFETRIQNLGTIHSLLSRFDWSGAGLHSLAKVILEPFQKRGKQNISINGPEVLLSPKYAVTLSIILHELASNALKYGSLSVPSGRVELAWYLDGSDHSDRIINLSWLETGGPVIFVAPKRRGFGTALIELSPKHELGGSAKLEFKSSGLNYELVFALKRSSPHTPAVENL